MPVGISRPGGSRNDGLGDPTVRPSMLPDAVADVIAAELPPSVQAERDGKGASLLLKVSDSGGTYARTATARMPSRGRNAICFLYFLYCRWRCVSCR